MSNEGPSEGAPPAGGGGGNNRRRRRRGRGGPGERDDARAGDATGDAGERPRPAPAATNAPRGPAEARGERPAAPRGDRPGDDAADRPRPAADARGDGNRPRGERPRGPNNPNNNSDRPRQDRASGRGGERPAEARGGDRPRGERPNDARGERPRNERPSERAPQPGRGERPRNERPQQSARPDRPSEPRGDRGGSDRNRGPRDNNDRPARDANANAARDNDRAPRDRDRRPERRDDRPAAAAPTQPQATPPSGPQVLARPSAEIDAGWGTLDDSATPPPAAAAAEAAAPERLPTPIAAKEARDPDGEDIFTLADEVQVPAGTLANVAGVKFRDAGTIYEFDAGEVGYVRGDRIVVESDRGPLVGTIAVSARRLPVLDPLRRILRRAVETDERAKDKNAAREREAYLYCKQRIRDHRLGMKLVRVEYPLSSGKVLFFFASDERVDFRDLVKDLAAKLHARIEMRQIGARDEAKMVGGIGSCGRELCCSTWLPAFVPVSIKMAKDQGLVLNPSKVSGQCGRLKCCLVYEHDLYKEMRKTLPKVGKRVSTPAGNGKVVELDVLRQKVRVWFDEGGSEIFPPDVLTVLVPPPQLGKRGLPVVPNNDAEPNDSDDHHES